jgi:hypothetical protein
LWPDPPPLPSRSLYPLSPDQVPPPPLHGWAEADGAQRLQLEMTGCQILTVLTFKALACTLQMTETIRNTATNEHHTTRLQHLQHSD